MSFYLNFMWILCVFLGITSESLSIHPEHQNPIGTEPDPSDASLTHKIKSFASPLLPYSQKAASTSLLLPSIKERQYCFENLPQTGRMPASVAQDNEDRGLSSSLQKPFHSVYSEEEMAGLLRKSVLLPEISTIISRHLDQQSLAAMRETCQLSYQGYNGYKNHTLVLDLSQLEPLGNRSQESLIRYLSHHRVTSNVRLKSPRTQIFVDSMEQAGAFSHFLQTITLSNTGLYGFSVFPLYRLSHLKRIDLSNAEDSDTLPQNQIASLAPFRPFLHLEILDLSGNPVSDVSDIKNLPALRALMIDRTNLNQEAVDCLRDAPWLEALSLAAPWGADEGLLDTGSFLTPLTNLTSLTIANHGLGDLPPLSQHLVRLDVSNNGLEDLNFAQNLTKLKILLASGNQIESADPVSNLKALETLNLSHNGISRATPFSALSNLSDLDLGYNPIKSINPLERLVNLKKLRLNKASLTTVEGICSLINLEVLDISDNKAISSFLPLSTLKKLTTLYVDNTEINDVGPLAVLHLRSLYLSGSRNLKKLAPPRKNQRSIFSLFR